MKFSVQNLETSKKVSDLELLESVFNAPVRRDLLHRVVNWQLARRRAGTHSTKTVAEVSGTGKKPFRQKGTGNARQGNKRSPLQRTGGVSHGPKPRDYGFNILKKVRKFALRSALSSKYKGGNLFIVESLDLKTVKTKDLIRILDKNNWKKVLFIDGERVPTNFAYASSNIIGVDLLPQQGANVYSILRSEKLVLTKDAARHLEERLK